MIVTKDTKLHDVVISEPAIIAVLSRFDITLGIGDNTVLSMPLSMMNIRVMTSSLLIKKNPKPSCIARVTTTCAS